MTEKSFKLVNPHTIHYDGDYFNLHKQSDIRSLVKVIGYITDENEQLKRELKKKDEIIELYPQTNILMQ